MVEARESLQSVAQEASSRNGVLSEIDDHVRTARPSFTRISSECEELRFADNEEPGDSSPLLGMSPVASLLATTTATGEKYSLCISDPVQVYSSKTQVWCDGYVDKVDGNMVTVAFQVPKSRSNEWSKKTLPVDHKDLRRVVVSDCTLAKRPLVVEILHAKGLRDADTLDISDPYCTVQIEGVKESRRATTVKLNTLEPEWYEYLEIPEYIVGQTLVFRVYDSDAVEIDELGDNRDDFLGMATLPPINLPSGTSGVLALRLVGAGIGYEPVLKVKVYDAAAAPDIYVNPESFKRSSSLDKLVPIVQIMRAVNLRNTDHIGKSDPYVTLHMKDREEIIGRTSVVDDCLNPEWYEDFLISNYVSGEDFVFKVWDEDQGKNLDDFLGMASLPSDTFLPSGCDVVELHLVGSGMGTRSILKVRVGITSIVAHGETQTRRETQHEMLPLVEPASPSMANTILMGGSVTYDELKDARLKFEGGDASLGEIAKRRLREQFGERKSATEVERFLQRMRDKGEGSITIAWRRYFDADGDGELSFGEFCNALVDFEWKGDVVKLWHALGQGAKELSLEMLDPGGAEILDTFTNWCIEVKGGPYEVFKALDDDGSDSLEPQEFVDGLQQMGFFAARNLPCSLLDGPSVLENLYPLLDQGGLGCVQGEQVLFLEKDKKKRAKIMQERARIKEFGQDAMLEPLTSGADSFLHKLCMENTTLGGKSYKLLRGENARLACGEGEKPRKTWRNNGGPAKRGDAREHAPFKYGERRNAWPKMRPSPQLRATATLTLNKSVSLPRLF